MLNGYMWCWTDESWWPLKIFSLWNFVDASNIERFQEFKWLLQNGSNDVCSTSCYVNSERHFAIVCEKKEQKAQLNKTNHRHQHRHRQLIHSLFTSIWNNGIWSRIRHWAFQIVHYLYKLQSYGKTSIRMLDTIYSIRDKMSVEQKKVQKGPE